jgi:hypothetical protein
MKATTMIVLGGLLFAGTALAADPQQATNTATTTNNESGSKVGFDARTGKLRRLTAAESAHLDAITAKNKAALAKAKGKTAAKTGPVTFVASNGMTVVELDETHMTEVQATIGADGKVIVSHDGQPLQGAVEAANE